MTPQEKADMEAAEKYMLDCFAGGTGRNPCGIFEMHFGVNDMKKSFLAGARHGRASAFEGAARHAEKYWGDNIATQLREWAKAARSGEDKGSW